MVNTTPAWVDVKLDGPQPKSARVRDPEHFVSGGVHGAREHWEDILKRNASSDFHGDIGQWLREGVNVSSFFRHFKGNFRGFSINSSMPQDRYFPNYKS